MPSETREFKFSIGEKVTLIAIDRPARVAAQLHDTDGAQYRVIYWHNGERKNDWLFADEIKTAT